MAVVAPDKLDAFLAVTDRWDVEAAVLGEVTEGDRLVITWHGETIVDVDPTSVAHDGPVYERPIARPEWLDAVQADGSAALPRPDDLGRTLLDLLASPNLCDKSWVTNQYDRYVLGNTRRATPHDSGVVRIDEESGLGVAVSTDCNGRFGRLDPYAGAQLALAESYRNVATSGALPLAVTDCLNFGSPEDPGVMWQFQQAVAGLFDACLELGIPVTGGNVSFYNQTGDTAIHPTPVVGVLGVLDDVATSVASGFTAKGEIVLLLGETRDELDGGEWAHALHGHLGGRPPRVDLAKEKDLADFFVEAVRRGLLTSSHDLSDGGLAIALAESVLQGGTGASVDLTPMLDRDGIDAFTALYSESAARALVTVRSEADLATLVSIAETHGVPLARLGVTDGASLKVKDALEVTAEEMRAAHTGTMQRYFG